MPDDIDDTDATEDYLSFFRSIVTNINTASADILFASLGDILANQDIRAHLADHTIQKYIYVVGLLSFTGREITKDNVKSILITLGEQPDNELLDVLFGAKPEGHLIYLYSIYLILVMGQKPETQVITRLVKALGITPNPETAEKVLELFNEKYA